jgi:WD40 repeat protein
VFIVDVSKGKIITKLENSHYGGVLSCSFDPLKPFVLCTTGMDHSIKFWDVRKPTCPISGIYNNSHWIWSCKYNRGYSNLMISCSSSSIVRGIAFEKEKHNDEISFTNNMSSNDTYNSTYLQNYYFIDFVEFEDSVYALDWFHDDFWSFAAVSFNSNFYVNRIPDEIKYKVRL